MTDECSGGRSISRDGVDESHGNLHVPRMHCEQAGDARLAISALEPISEVFRVLFGNPKSVSLTLVSGYDKTSDSGGFSG